MIKVGHTAVVVCPYCEAERLCEKVQSREVYNYKNQNVSVVARYLVCKKCELDFNDLTDPYDLAAEIVKEYHRCQRLKPS